MLTDAVKSYLAVRRACGFDLDGVGQRLQSFATYSEAAGESFVCVQTAIDWAGLAGSVRMRARRLGEVTRFARYMRAEDPQHELPPPVFGSEHRPRPVPYIFSQSEIEQLVQATFHSRYDDLRRDTYSTVFALLACTGLRVSEALHLCYEDITPDGLVIRRSKFHKSRLVPLHETARGHLELYLERRRRHPPFDDPHLFVSVHRKPLSVGNVDFAFHTAATKIGLPCGPGHPRATPHSLRHTFAVRALETCPDGRDCITKHMVSLSTYLGHSSIAHTYWYLDATPELMKNIAERCEGFFFAGERP
jgi:integrase/recombinase XerD